MFDFEEINEKWQARLLIAGSRLSYENILIADNLDSMYLAIEDIGPLLKHCQMMVILAPWEKHTDDLDHVVATSRGRPISETDYLLTWRFKDGVGQKFVPQNEFANELRTHLTPAAKAIKAFGPGFYLQPAA